MRTLQLIITCDNCANVFDEDGPISGITLTYDDGTAFTADLCVDCCNVPIFDAFTAAPKKKKQTKTTRSDKLPLSERTVPCDQCSRSFATRRGLHQHITKSHTNQ